mmetsp:Transcript_40546/g.99640  ORF Transcript_40546/g.99640 Transcript_40546/m.99640 type:complete len:418 (+) Transcript_40546:60-1313(+)
MAVLLCAAVAVAVTMAAVAAASVRVSVDERLQRVMTPWLQADDASSGVHWTGADCDVSTRLDKHNVLWIFADTLLGYWNGAQRQRMAPPGTKMPHSSVAVHNTSSDRVRYAWRGGADPTHAESLYSPKWQREEGPAFWPYTVLPRDTCADAAVCAIGGRIEYGGGDSVFGFRSNGSHVGCFVFADARRSPLSWRQRWWHVPHTGITARNAEVEFNNGAYVHADGHVYQFGYYRPKPDDGAHTVQTLMRVERSAWCMGNFSAAQYWVRSDAAPAGGTWYRDGRGGAPPVARLAPVWPDFVAEVSVVYSPVLRRFVVPFVDFAGTRLRIRTARAITGPWEYTYDDAYALPPPFNDTAQFFCYAVKVHDAYSSVAADNRVHTLSVSFVCNAYDIFTLYKPDYRAVYTPQLVRVELRRGDD